MEGACHSSFPTRGTLPGRDVFRTGECCHRRSAEGRGSVVPVLSWVRSTESPQPEVWALSPVGSRLVLIFPKQSSRGCPNVIVSVVNIPPEVWHNLRSRNGITRQLSRNR